MSQLSELIAYLDEVRQQMEELVSRIDPSLLICPGWTIKEVIGHIAAWEIVIHKAIQAFAAGEAPYFLQEQDFDRFNQEAVSQRAGWPLEEVLKEWRGVRNQQRETILALKEEQLQEELVLPWGSERTLAELIEILGDHENEHLEGALKAAN